MIIGYYRSVIGHSVDGGVYLHYYREGPYQ
jgi:hypothetical protein